MNRFEKIRELFKFAQSFEAALDMQKIKQTEERAGTSLDDFQNEVASILLAKQMGLEGADIGGVSVEGSIILEALLDGADVWSDPTFEYPYDFLVADKSPQQYADYLEEKTLSCVKRKNRRRI